MPITHVLTYFDPVELVDNETVPCIEAIRIGDKNIALHVRKDLEERGLLVHITAVDLRVTDESDEDEELKAFESYAKPDKDETSH